MDWQWALNPLAKHFTGKEPEAVEIFENFHSLLHGSTSAAFGADVE